MPAGRVRALFGEDLDAIMSRSGIEHGKLVAITKRGGVVRLGDAEGRGDGDSEIEAALLDAHEIGRGVLDLDVVAETRSRRVRRALRLSFAQWDRPRRGGLRVRRPAQARGDAQTIRRNQDVCP